MNTRFLQRLLQRPMSRAGGRTPIVGLHTPGGSEPSAPGHRELEIEPALAKRGASYFCDPEPTVMFASPFASSLPDTGDPRDRSAGERGEIREGMAHGMAVRLMPGSRTGGFFRDPEPTPAFGSPALANHRLGLGKS